MAVEPCWGSGAGAVLVRRNLTAPSSDLTPTAAE
jgi:hypothetical protein